MATPPAVTQAPPRQEQRPLDTLETSLRMTYEEFLAWAGEDVHAEAEIAGPARVMEALREMAARGPHTTPGAASNPEN